MILVGNSRGGARDLAQHLQKDENDHVTVHQLRGFASDNLDGAFQEAYAVSRGTKCKQFLFSLSLNPPADAQVTSEQFESAIDRAEGELGLGGQPRAIVFHEKEGRRHAHAVWSRIDAETMTAKQMSFHKNKLQDVSRELYNEHGWTMPEGLADRTKSDPRNFTLEQWQQAKRHDKDPQQIIDAFRDAWAISDSKAAFDHALKERGYWLARGDKRGFVALDHNGEIYSIPKQVKVKTKAVRDKLGHEDDLPSLTRAKESMAKDMSAMLSRLQDEQYEKAAALKAEHNSQKQALVDQQRSERAAQDRLRLERQHQEQAERQARFRKGLAGLWDRLRGEHKRLTEQNRLEALASQQRDKVQRDALVFNQLTERRELNEKAKARYQDIQAQKQELQQDQKRLAEIAQQREEISRKKRRQKVPRQEPARAPPERTRPKPQEPRAAFNTEAAKPSPADDKAAKRQAFIAQRQRQAKEAQERRQSRGPELER
ncbi:MAG: relaxase/mobilization nuclease domain-containing protein [Pseudomonadota bacterium]